MINRGIYTYINELKLIFLVYYKSNKDSRGLRLKKMNVELVMLNMQSRIITKRLSKKKIVDYFCMIQHNREILSEY